MRKFLCCCSGGKVRSVAAKYILNDRHGLKGVLAVGLDKTDADTLAMLFDWADVILVVGEGGLVGKVPAGWQSKVRHLDVGEDTYHNYANGKLNEKLGCLLSPLVVSRDDRGVLVSEGAPPRDLHGTAT